MCVEYCFHHACILFDEKKKRERRSKARETPFGVRRLERDAIFPSLLEGNINFELEGTEDRRARHTGTSTRLQKSGHVKITDTAPIFFMVTLLLPSIKFSIVISIN